MLLLHVFNPLQVDIEFYCSTELLYPLHNYFNNIHVILVTFDVIVIFSQCYSLNNIFDHESYACTSYALMVLSAACKYILL